MASASDLLAGTQTVAEVLGAVQRLMSLAFTCPTTALHNKRALDEITKLAITFDESTMYGALMIDLTGFKQVNDQGGHAAGNAALGLVGETLAAMCSRDGPFGGALPFRYGGDEFCVLVPASIFDVFVEASNLDKLRWREFTLEGKALGFGAAIGIARPDRIELQKLIERADAAGRVSKDRDDKPVTWSNEVEREATTVSRRKRCHGCTATITLNVAEERMNSEGFKTCPNCGGPLP